MKFWQLVFLKLPALQYAFQPESTASSLAHADANAVPAQPFGRWLRKEQQDAETSVQTRLTPEIVAHQLHEEHAHHQDVATGNGQSYVDVANKSKQSGILVTKSQIETAWVAPGEILKSIVTNSVAEGHGPQKALVNNVHTYWKAESPQAALTFEMFRKQTIGGIRVKQPSNVAGGAFRGASISWSRNGITWSIVKHAHGDDQKCCDFQEIDFTPISAKYWKFDILSTHSSANATLAYLQFKVVSGEVEGESSGRLVMCLHEGSFSHHGRCLNQKSAEQACSDVGLKLCSMHEIEDEIGRGCNLMYTSTSSTQGFHVSTGESPCYGSEGKMYSEIDGLHGPGMFDAACCPVPATTTTTSFVQLVVHEEFGTYILKSGHGGCATNVMREPPATIKPHVQSMEACRKMCDSDDTCAALSWCGAGDNCYGNCYMYSNEFNYTTVNMMGHSKRCWIRKGMVARTEPLSQATTAWRNPATLVKKVTASSELRPMVATDVLEDDEKFWKTEHAVTHGKLTFEMIGPQKLSALRIKLPRGEPGTSMKSFQVEYSLDGQQWQPVRRSEHANQACCDFGKIEFPATVAPFWRLNIFSNHGSPRGIALQYIEFLVTTTQSSCQSFLPTLSLLEGSATDFLMFANMGSQRNGGIPFGSGSMSMQCDVHGPGMGVRFGRKGQHCFHNINDDKEGLGSSWMPGEKFNGNHFVGVQLQSHTRVHGIRISTPASYDANVGGWYHIQYTGLPSVDYDTADVNWCTIGSFTRDSAGLLFKRLSEPVNASAIRILVSDQAALMDEVQVFGEVQALPVTDGLVADLRGMAYAKGATMWGNQVAGGSSTTVPRKVSFNEGQQGFEFDKGGPTIQLPLKTDPIQMPEVTYAAWVRLKKADEGGCVDMGSLGSSLDQTGEDEHMEDNEEDEVDVEENDETDPDKPKRRGRHFDQKGRRAQKRAPKDTSGSVMLSLTIENLHYLLLSANLKEMITTMCEHSIAQLAGVGKEAVKVTLAPGSVKISAIVWVGRGNEYQLLATLKEQERELGKVMLAGLGELSAVGIDLAKAGDLSISPPTGYVLPKCASTDAGRGWIVSQAPDFGRSRALVLADWQGGMSMDTGKVWNSGLGKPPVGEWFFVAGVFRQNKESFMFFNGRTSEEVATPNNTAAGDYLELQHSSERCLGTKPQFHDSLVLRKCSITQPRSAFLWKPGRWQHFILESFNGKCVRACDDWFCGGDSHNVTKLIMDECKEDDERYQFKKFTMHDGSIQLQQKGKVGNKPVCVRPLVSADKVELMLGDCAVEEDTKFKEVVRLDQEVLSIGGRADWDRKHNPQILISDVAVYGRALNVTELNWLYQWGRPSTPANVMNHCPLSTSLVGGLCTASEYREYCEYLTKERVESCETYCYNQEHSTCVSAAAAMGDSCGRGQSVSCSSARANLVCRCMAAPETTTTTTGFTGTVFAVGRDEHVYRQSMTAMSEVTDWQQIGPCCVQSVALTDDMSRIYGVSPDNHVVMLPLSSFGTSSQWNKVGKCCVTSIAIDGEDIYAVKDNAVHSQKLADITLDSDWSQVGRCCVTSIAFAGDVVFVSGPDGQVYTQTKQNMLDGQRWILSAKGGVRSVTAVGNYLYAAGADDAIYRQPVEKMTTESDWTLTGKCCMRHMATFAPPKTQVTLPVEPGQSEALSDQDSQARARALTE